MSDEGQFEQEKTRLCPSCRMEISVLATKCRFCGEPVGRPKDETRQLTVKDLGGETVHHYAPSSNVMDALESFRAEEFARQEAARRRKPKTLLDRFRGRREEAAPEESGGLPQLDAESQALASLVYPAQAPAQPEAASVVWTRKLAYVGAFVAAVLILYFGAVQVGAMIREYIERNAPVDDFVSQVPSLIEQGAPPVQVLEAAVTAVRHRDNEEHRAQLEQARRLVRSEVEALLNADPWTPNHLQRASGIAHRAASIDSSREMHALRDEVNEESWSYNILVREVETDDRGVRATLRLVHPQRATRDVTVRVGDMVDDRFRVISISRGESRVRMEDTERGGRRLSCTMTSSLM